MAPGSPVTFSGTATDDEGLNYVDDHPAEQRDRREPRGRRHVGHQRAAPATTASRRSSIGGTTYNWSYTTPFNLTSGTYTFSVRATDDLGLTTSSTNQGRLTINVQVPGDAFPNAHDQPDRHAVNGVQVLHLDLAGAATDDIGVSAVRVTVEEQRQRPLPPAQRHAVRRPLACSTRRWRSPGATSTTWTLSVDLPTAGRLRGDGVSPTTRRTSRTPRPRGRHRATRSTRVTCRRPSPRTCSHRRKAPPSPTAGSSSAAGSRTTSRSPRRRWRSGTASAST